MKCPLCKKEQTKIVRLTQEGATQTFNETEICENPKCSFYIDVKKLKNWVIVSRPKKETK
jgi:transcriptional regulator NrdR family protein